MTPSEIRALGAKELATKVQLGDISALQVATAYLGRSHEVEGSVRAFLHLDDDAVLARAEAIDARREKGAPLGALAGVPISIKDNIAVRGLPTTCGSRILARHRPLYDATVVARMLAADALLFGKTNLDEFGMGSSTENSAFGPTHNPWDLGRVPGGSSGGTAAALASGQSLLGLGSDTGGSVRQPASFCGLVGLKPHYGRISRYGLVAFASSLDTIGVLGRSAEDVRTLFREVAGEDGLDATSLRRDDASLVPAGRGPDAIADEPLAGVRIGVPRALVEEGVDGDVLEVLTGTEARFRALGADLVDVQLPAFTHSVPTYYVIADAEASSNLARYDGIRFGSPADVAASSTASLLERTRGRGLGLEVKRRVLLGTFALSHGYADAYYERAQAMRAQIAGELGAVLRGVDAILLPTAPTVAFELGEKRGDPLGMYLSDVFTLPASLSRNPAISFPAGVSGARVERTSFSDSDGDRLLPVGMQLLARPHAEEFLLGLVEAHESVCSGEGSVRRDRSTPAFGRLRGGR